MKENAKIYIPGHSGLVGSYLLEKLREGGYRNLITATHRELDLSRADEVDAFFAQERPEYVFMLAARMGGVQSRLNQPVDMLMDNSAMTLNVLRAAWKSGVKKLLYIASGLVYPTGSVQPLRPESIGLQELDTANEPYALAKILGIRLCQYMKMQYQCNFISCIPCNIYGEVRETDSQFIPMTIKKFAEAPEEIVVWGDGTPVREFLHAEDLANALIFLMEHYEGMESVNIGTDKEWSISEIVELLQNISQYSGTVRYDPSKPNGAQRLFMDSSVIREMGWQPDISLEEGLRREFTHYKERKQNRC